MPSSAAGIYKIENQVNGKCYVGSAVMLDRRMRKHKTELNRRNKDARLSGESFQK